MACTSQGQRSRAGGLLAPLTEESAEFFGAAGRRFVLKDLLGSGSYGSVYRCLLESNNGSEEVFPEAGLPVEYAVKVINARYLADVVGAPLELVFPRLEREVEILKMVGSNPNILTLHFAFFSEESHRYYLVTECIPGSDLFQKIVQQRRPFKESDARTIFAQIVDAVAFCHSQGVAHRDLKLENILLDERESGFKIKLCDYGQAKVLGGGCFTDTTHTLTATPAYAAPEVKRAVDVALPYDAFKVDAFGLGVVLYGMLCSAVPDAARGPAYERHQHWFTLSEQARELIQGLLDPDPEQRLSVDGARQHPWLVTSSSPASSSEGAGSGFRPRSSQIPELDILQSGQTVVQAIQRERGCGCWAVNSSEGETQHHWRVKYTDERFDEVKHLLSSYMEKCGPDVARWRDFDGQLDNVCKELNHLRKRCSMAFDMREDNLNEEETFADIFSKYTDVTGKAIAAMTMLVSKCSQRAVPLMEELRYRYLQNAGEQIGRERAFLCGHLDRPETLRLSSVVVELAKMIGARQVFVGYSCPSQNDVCDVVVSGTGMLPMLGLAGEPLIDASDLRRLEDAEALVLNARKSRPPATAEAFYLTTEIIDKIHQHIAISLMELFSTKSNGSDCSSRQPSLLATGET